MPVFRQWPRDPRYWMGDDGSIIGPARRVLRQLRPTGTDTNKYLRFCRRMSGGKYVTRTVHVAMAEAWLGPRPDGMQCCHDNGDRFDNRPSNLKWGTPLENGADKRRHGTAPRGECNSRAVLKNQDVLTIRRDYAEGRASQRELARRYSVTAVAIGLATKGRTWAHLGGPLTPPKGKYRHGTAACGERVATAVLSEQDVLVIRKEYAGGLVTQKQLASRYGVGREAIRAVVHGKAWAHAGGPLTPPKWRWQNKKTSK